MLVTFESEVGRITMFGDIAVQLIRMMGRPGTVPSALLADDVPGALAMLRQSLDAAEEPVGPAATDDEEEAGAKAPVSQRQRAFPLIKLLEDAAKHHSDVMWESLGSGPLQF